MRRLLIRAGAATTLAAATLAASLMYGASAAFPVGTASPSSPVCAPALLAQGRALVGEELSARAAQLTTLLTATDATASRLTSGDQQALQHDIGTVDQPGIQGLETTVQQVATCDQLRSAAHAMVYDYRVYYVMTPQTYLTIAADQETYVEGLVAGLEPSITAALAAAQTRGVNVTAAQAADTDLVHQVAAAQAATSGLSNQVLAQTAQDYPSSWSVFLAVRTGETEAHVDLQTAYADAVQIRQTLG